VSDRFEDLLAAYLDGELDEEGMQQLTDMLKTDPERQARLREEMRLQVLMREVATEEAAGETAPAPRPGSARRSSISRRRPERRSSGLFKLVLVAAACVGIVIGLRHYGLWPEGATAMPEVMEAGDTVVIRAAAELPATAGMLLEPGDTVQVGASGQASLKYQGEATRVILRGGTDVAFQDENGAKHLELAAGEVDCDVARQRQPMIITTPHGRAEVRGTRLKLSVHAEYTRLEVTQGVVGLTRLSDNATIDVHGDEYALAGPNVALKALPLAGTPPSVVARALPVQLKLPDNEVALTATVEDIDVPTEDLTIAWTKVSGPGDIAFADATQSNTTVQFTDPGTYVLKCTARDPRHSSSSDITVTVLPPARIYTAWRNDSAPGMRAECSRARVVLRKTRRDTTKGMANAMVDVPAPLGSHVRLKGRLTLGAAADTGQAGSPYPEFHGRGALRLVFHKDGHAVLESRLTLDGKPGPFIKHGKLITFDPQKPITFDILVNRDQVTCHVNGELVYSGRHKVAATSETAWMNTAAVRAHAPGRTGIIATFRDLELTVNP
jgi:ferric-dicitrate binding protein FerR (iron transport regulator)